MRRQSTSPTWWGVSTGTQCSIVYSIVYCILLVSHSIKGYSVLYKVVLLLYCISAFLIPLFPAPADVVTAVCILTVGMQSGTLTAAGSEYAQSLADYLEYAQQSVLVERGREILVLTGT